MGKGQSFIIEFIMFFTISFSLFITISLIFHNQNKFFEERLGEKTSELVNDIVSTDIINGVNCKSCERVIITENLPPKIGGFSYTIRLDNNGLNLTLFSLEQFSEQTLVFNLNETFIFLNSESRSENKIVGIKINNVGKDLKVE